MNRLNMKTWLLVGWLAIVPQLNGSIIKIPDIKSITINNKSLLTKFMTDFNNAALNTTFVGKIDRSTENRKTTYTFSINDQSINLDKNYAQIAYTTSGTPSSATVKIFDNNIIRFQKIKPAPPAPPAPPKTVTLNLTKQLTDIRLHGNNISPFSNTSNLITILNAGGLVGGTIQSGVLTLYGYGINNVSGTSNGTPLYIEYQYAGDTNYTQKLVGDGTKVTIIGPVPQSVTLNLTTKLSGIQLYGTGIGSYADKGTVKLIDGLNSGQTVTGTITAAGGLILTSSDKSINAIGTFSGAPSYVEYQYVGDTSSYSRAVAVGIGTAVTIIGTKPAPPPASVTLNLTKQLTDIRLHGNSISSFNNKDNLITILNAGGLVGGTIQSGVLTLYGYGINNVSGTSNGTPLYIEYLYAGDTNYTQKLVGDGTKVTIIGPVPQSVTLNLTAKLSGIQSYGTSSISFDKMNDLINALNAGETVRGSITAAGVLTLKSTTSATTATTTFYGAPSYVEYEYVGDTSSYSRAVAVGIGTVVTIIGTKPAPPAPKTVTITIPEGTTDFGDINILGDKSLSTSIRLDFTNVFATDLFDGLTVTGQVTLTGIDWKYSGGTLTTLTNDFIPTGLSFSTKPVNPATDSNFMFNVGDTIKIIGTKPAPPASKTVTVNIPVGTTGFTNVNIMDGSENPLIVSLFNGIFFKDLLTNGLTVTGVILNNGIKWQYSGGTISSSTSSKPYELDMYLKPSGVLRPSFNVGDTIKIVGITPPPPPSSTPFTINMPTDVQVNNLFLIDNTDNAVLINNLSDIKKVLIPGKTIKATTATNVLNIYDGNLDTSKIISTNTCSVGNVSDFQIVFDNPYGLSKYPLQPNTTYAISVIATPVITVTIPKANLPIAGLWVFWNTDTGPQANKFLDDKAAAIINDIANGYKIVGSNTGDTLTLTSGSDVSVGKTGERSTGNQSITAFQYNYNSNKNSVNTPLLPGQGIVLQLGT